MFQHVGPGIYWGYIGLTGLHGICGYGTYMGLLSNSEILFCSSYIFNSKSFIFFSLLFFIQLSLFERIMRFELIPTAWKAVMLTVNTTPAFCLGSRNRTYGLTDPNRA